MSALDRDRLNRAVARVNHELLAALGPDGHWAGELSSSALSTATAITALAVVERESQISNHRAQIDSGLQWLAQHQNTDGGWGDTLLSLSNLSTTTLCWAAFGAVPGAEEKFTATVRQAEGWIASRLAGVRPSPGAETAESSAAGRFDALGQPNPAAPGDGRTPSNEQLKSVSAKAPARIKTDALARAIIARYGKDRTFSVPILTMCALAGRLGSGREAWKHVIPLPFELAAFPHSWFAALRLPVVSYALPALIAIGQVRHIQSPSRNPVARLARSLTRETTLRKLTSIQPENGGFLEATPLTSFVTMSLAGSGQANHPVTKRGVEFLVASQRTDGSWPIDTNLATWVTTLAVNALAGRTGFQPVPSTPEATKSPATSPGNPRPSTIETGWKPVLRRWLLNQQYRTIHPYTHAAPGGWAWTNLPGGVPDADDTAGALLALRQLGPIDDATREAAIAGVTWLLDLQNRDGGIPTFCRGWGALPFDQSSADITAHVIRAWLAWFDDTPTALQSRIVMALERALNFLINVQRSDGTWLPLWFGNQHMPDDQNPTYGTAKVLTALSEAIEFGLARKVQNPLRSALQRTYEAEAKAHLWLSCTHRGPSTGWGGGRQGPPSVEETSLVAEGLAAALGRTAPKPHEEVRSRLAAESGVNWLLDRVESDEWTQPSPIGFYFAKLWYYEKLYPMIFTVAALNRAQQIVSDQAQTRGDTA